MDEVVFARESLRRALLACADELERAARDYDPESDFPVDDLAVALLAGGLQKPVSDYGKAVAHRVKSRAAARGRRPPSSSAGDSQ